MKKKIILFLLVVGFALVITSPALATHTLTTDGQPAGGISYSRHNLSSSGTHIKTTATSEVCVFCHTPHHAAGTGGSGAQPLWNRGIATPYFQPYIFYRDAAVVAPQPTYASLACLSCHDGVTTFDNLINAPGKGGFTPGGTDQVWTFTGEGSSATIDSLGEVSLVTPAAARLVIGVDLTDDHPISMQYRDPEVFDPDGDGYGATASLRPRSTQLKSVAADTSGDPTDGVPNSAQASFNRWAVHGFITDEAKIEDLLKGVERTVECSSCHDPHYKNMTNPEIDDTYASTPDPNPSVNNNIIVHNIDFDPTTGSSNEIEVDGLFLRRVGGNNNSGVCRTCHAK